MKDIRIEFGNRLGLLLFMGLPLVFLFLLNYANEGMVAKCTVYVDAALHGDFQGRTSAEVSYLGEPVEIYFLYLPKKEILEDLESGRCPLGIYRDDVEGKTIHLNPSHEGSMKTYHVLREFLMPMAGTEFALRQSTSFQSPVLALVVNLFVILGSVSFGRTSLRRELADKNILFLLKAGLSPAQILTSKLLFVLVLMNLLFALFMKVAQGMIAAELGLTALLLLQPVIILSTLTGLFLSTISLRAQVQSFLQTLLWLPSFFYPLLKATLPALPLLLLKANPLILATEMLDSMLIEQAAPLLIGTLALVGTLLFIVSIFTLNRAILRNI